MHPKRNQEKNFLMTPSTHRKSLNLGHSHQKTKTVHSRAKMKNPILRESVKK